MSEVNENNDGVVEVEEVDTETVDTVDTDNDKDNSDTVEVVDESVDNNADKSVDKDSGDEDEADFKALFEKWKGLSRKNENSSKENYKRVQELESEVETLKKGSPDVESLKQDNLNLLKRIVVSEYNLPESAANRLVGASEDELRADAEELSKLVGGSQKGMKPVKIHGTDQQPPGEVKVGSRAEWREQMKK